MTRSVRILIVFVMLNLAGCDPGVSYVPVDSSNTPVTSWATEVDGVRLMTQKFSMLAGSSGMGQGITVANHSDADVVLISGTLITNGKSIPGEMMGEGELKWRTVPPGETAEVGCGFDLWSAGGVASEVLDPTFVVEWEFQIDSEIRRVTTTMQQVDW